MLTKLQLRDDLLLKLGREVPASATTAELADVVRAVNGALQMLWLAGAQYFLRHAVSVPLVADQAVYTLAATLQDVRGPVRAVNGTVLRQFNSRVELEDYALEVLGASTRTVASGTPWGCLLEHESVANPSVAADTHAMSLRVIPAPNAAAVAAMSPLVIDGVAECPTYTEANLAAGGTLPVPDGYAEAFLLPLARAEICRSSLFSRAELVPLFEADAAAVRARLFRREGDAGTTGDVGAQAPIRLGLMSSGEQSSEGGRR